MSSRSAGTRIIGRGAAIALLALTMLLTTACWPLAETAPGAKAGDSRSLRLGGWPAPLTLDPARAADPTAQQVTRLIYSGLMGYDSAMKLQPDLAADFPISRDGITYTFTLRKDASLHNGKRVTAADIKYSIERACQPATVPSSELPCAHVLGNIVGVADTLAGRGGGISGIRALDDLHLSIVLSGTDNTFPYKLAEPVAFVVDHDQVQSDPTWAQHPVGSGPYRVQGFDGQRLELAHYPDYYGELPTLDYLDFQFGGEAVADYKAGKLDVAWASGTASSAASLTSPNLRLTYWGLNNRVKPFDDPHVRAAFAAALDVDSLPASGSVPAYDLVPPAWGGVGSGRFDLSAARQLLAASSYKGADSLPPITIYTSGDPLAAQVSRAMSANLGVSITVQTVEYSDLLANHSDYQSFITDFAAPYAEPSATLGRLLRSNSADNWVGYSNGAVEQQLVMLGSVDDPASRPPLLRKLLTTITADTPLVPLRWGASSVLIQPYVQGLEARYWGFEFRKVQIKGR